jgi:hypothetical protein
LFDVEDDIATRVIQTASLTITMAKATTRTTTRFDHKGFTKALLALLPELEEQIIKLTEEYTTSKTTSVSPGLTTSYEDPDLLEGFVDTSKSYLQSLLKWFDIKGKIYDMKLNKLAKAAGMVA